jgi:HSP20 family molecular chaperone IbpA
MSTHFDPLGLRFFEDAVTRLLSEPRASRPWSPAVDIYETEDALVLKADLPDVEMKDIDIRLENETLTISGERKFEKKDEAKGFHRIERSYGNFVRSFSVPATINTEKEGRGRLQERRSHSDPSKKGSCQAAPGESGSQVVGDRMIGPSGDLA